VSNSEGGNLLNEGEGDYIFDCSTNTLSSGKKSKIDPNASALGGWEEEGLIRQGRKKGCYLIAGHT